MPKPPRHQQNSTGTKILDQSLDYNSWIAAAEFDENAERMQSALQAQTLTAETKQRLSAIERKVNCVAIAEDWCGDVIRHVPVLQKLAEACPQLRIGYVSREQFPELFVRFLTNGGEAIPKFIFLSEDLVECGNWGPMPESCKTLIARGKACGDVPAARKIVAEQYAADADKEIVAAELLELIERASCKSVSA